MLSAFDKSLIIVRYFVIHSIRTHSIKFLEAVVLCLSERTSVGTPLICLLALYWTCFFGSCQFAVFHFHHAGFWSSEECSLQLLFGTIAWGPFDLEEEEAGRRRQEGIWKNDGLPGISAYIKVSYQGDSISELITKATYSKAGYRGYAHYASPAEQCSNNGVLLCVDSINLMTCLGSLATIAKQRPQFMTRVVQGFEALHGMPALWHWLDVRAA